MSTQVTANDRELSQLRRGLATAQQTAKAHQTALKEVSAAMRLEAADAAEKERERHNRDLRSAVEEKERLLGQNFEARAQLLERKLQEVRCREEEEKEEEKKDGMRTRTRTRTARRTRRTRRGGRGRVEAG